MNRITLLAVAFVAIFSSCGEKTQDLTKLGSNTWKLTSMNNESNAAFDEKDAFTIEFSLADSVVSGVGACNRFFGRFEAEGESEIDINIGGSTMMACPNMELEQPFIEMLNESDSFVVDGDKLTLYDDEVVVAEFAAYKPE